MENENEEYISLPLMTVPESARYLGVGRKVIYQLIENGELAAVKDQGSLRIEKKSLDDFKAAGKMA